MIAAGLKIGESEFYWHNQEGFILSEGSSRPVELMTAEEKNAVDQGMNDKHKTALRQVGIDCPDAGRIQFLKCNCSTSDFTPDILDGKLQLTEYVSCDHRGSCSFEGKLCQPVIINGQRITMTELKVIALIRAGLYDKEICGRLKIAPQTLTTHKQNIERKLDADRKVQVALKAVQLGITL